MPEFLCKILGFSSFFLFRLPSSPCPCVILFLQPFLHFCLPFSLPFCIPILPLCNIFFFTSFFCPCAQSHVIFLPFALLLSLLFNFSCAFFHTHTHTPSPHTTHTTHIFQPFTQSTIPPPSPTDIIILFF